MAKQEASRDVVVAIAEHRGRDSDGIPNDSLRRIAAAVDLRLDILYNDAFSTFNRFHITQIFALNLAFP
jgi:hypothetical protein